MQIYVYFTMANGVSIFSFVIVEKKEYNLERHGRNTNANRVAKDQSEKNSRISEANFHVLFKFVCLFFFYSSS